MYLFEVFRIGPCASTGRGRRRTPWRSASHGGLAGNGANEESTIGETGGGTHNPLHDERRWLVRGTCTSREFAQHGQKRQIDAGGIFLL